MLDKMMDYLRRSVCMNTIKYMQLPSWGRLLLLPITLIYGILVALVCWIVYLIKYGRYGKKGWEMQKQDQAKWVAENLNDIMNECI